MLIEILCVWIWKMETKKKQKQNYQVFWFGRKDREIPRQQTLWGPPTSLSETWLRYTEELQQNWSTYCST